MAWSYTYTADGVDLSQHCQAVRVITEYGLASRSVTDFDFPGSHGVQYAPNKLMGAGNVVLVTYLRETDGAGLVTHTDGSSGHIYENLSALKTVFNKTSSLVTLRRVAPHIGAMILEVESVEQPVAGQDRFEVIWTLRTPKPVWRSEAIVNTASLTTGLFNPGGDAPVDDMVLTFTGAGSVVNGGDKVEVTASCTVDVGAKTVFVGPTPSPGLIRPNNERWLHLEGGTDNSLTVTGTVAMDHYPKWS